LRTRLLVVLALLVLLPLALLAWLGGRAMRGEQARLREQFEGLMNQRLGEVHRVMAGTIGERERELIELLDRVPVEAEPAPTAACREAAAGHPMVTGIFLLDLGGRMRHPPLNSEEISSEEMAFLERTSGLWSDGSGWGAAAEGAAAPRQGWRTWYHGGGPRLLFWRRQESGSVIGVEIPGSVMAADLIAKLPASGGGGTGDAGGTQVVWADAQGRPVYQWGEGSPDAPVAVRQPAPPPFSGWTLAVHAADVVGAGAGAWRLQWWAGLGAAALALGLLGVYLYRESSRDLRTAARRITFVNQVSHELKTPLTNISLYAELAAERLPPEAGAARECLEVVTAESARLGRLINNVLTFSRHQRGGLRARPQRCELDAEVADRVQPFALALAGRNIRLDLDLRSGATVSADPDSLGQILGNLLSNAEKYAAAGGVASVATRLAGDAAEVVISDRGPGIPAGLEERIFEPFFRASDKLTDGVAGVGLGLGLARELARSMNGDLTLGPPPASGGAVFVLRLPLAST
jgi:signal transduction histidine kinase